MRSQWETTPKIATFVGIMTLLIAYTYFIYIGPIYRQEQQIKQKQHTLQQLIQKKAQQLKQINQKKQQSAQVQKEYKAIMKEMDQTLMITTVIAQLIKKNKIIIEKLKPIKEEDFFNFKKSTLSLDIKGSELSLFMFIQQLQNQAWLIDMPAWQLDAESHGISFKATLDIYHAKNKASV